jgi:hypothetical protein
MRDTAQNFVVMEHFPIVCWVIGSSLFFPGDGFCYLITFSHRSSVNVGSLIVLGTFSHCSSVRLGAVAQLVQLDLRNYWFRKIESAAVQTSRKRFQKP